jgi:hypothetical protein
VGASCSRNVEDSLDVVDGLPGSFSDLANADVLIIWTLATSGTGVDVAQQSGGLELTMHAGARRGAELARTRQSAATPRANGSGLTSGE